MKNLGNMTEKPFHACVPFVLLNFTKLDILQVMKKSYKNTVRSVGLEKTTKHRITISNLLLTQATRECPKSHKTNFNCRYTLQARKKKSLLLLCITSLQPY